MSSVTTTKLSHSFQIAVLLWSMRFLQRGLFENLLYSLFGKSTWGENFNESELLRGYKNLEVKTLPSLSAKWSYLISINKNL